MRPSVPLKVLVLVLAGLSADTLMAAGEEHPRLDNHPSESVQAWNHTHPKGAVTNASKTVEPPATVTPANIDPSSEQAPPPIAITGPESLAHAIEQARNISHPTYKEKIRYHRSTHISFPLPSIESTDMSQTSIGDALNIQSPTEEEKKLSEGRITSQLDQDQRKLKSNSIEAGTSVTTSPLSINESMMTSGSRGRVNISVSGH